MAKDFIVGRKEEQAILRRVFKSDRAEFVALYGRRRIGKTVLVKWFFRNKQTIFFHITGIRDASMQQQLYEFTRIIESVFYKERITLHEPKNWLKAFELLTGIIKEKYKRSKIVLFFDELPWLSTPKSGFMQALDYYWNRYWVDMANVKLIVCGSAASWMIKHLVSNEAGLHNRITHKILLEPLTLKETKQYFRHRGFDYDDQQILKIYMIIGGVAFYLDAFDKAKTIHQNIDQICFNKKGLLFVEFEHLYASLFKGHKIYEELIRIIAKKRNGIDNTSLAQQAKQSTKGGRLYLRLKELEESGFIASFLPYKAKKKGAYYKVVDEYSLFYLKWIEPYKSKIRRNGRGYWQALINTPSYMSWAGYAYENICYKHVYNIQTAFGLSPLALSDSWQHRSQAGSDDEGAQIDLLFDDPHEITICEIKYTREPYRLTKEEAKKLTHKVDVFKKHTKIHKPINLALITAMPLKETMYSEELIHYRGTLYDLFIDRIRG